MESEHEEKAKTKDKSPLTNKIRDSVEEGIDQLSSLGDNVGVTLKDVRSNLSDFLSSANSGLDDIISKAENIGKESGDWLKHQSKEIFGSSRASKKKD